MGLYSDYLFPLGCDYLMATPEHDALRKDALKTVEGDVLEIGFGTGLNLPHYPDGVSKITTVEVSAGMNRKAQKRIEETGMDVECHVIDGKSLPMGDAVFDCIVSTWTICSISEIDLAMHELFRVLKPGGKLLFVEHGLSNDPKVQQWQNFFNPFQKIFAVGCNLNRDIRAIVEKPGLVIDELKEFYMDKAPKSVGYTYQGVALK